VHGTKFEFDVITFAHGGPIAVVMHVFNVKGWLPVYWSKLNEAVTVDWEPGHVWAPAGGSMAPSKQSTLSAMSQRRQPPSQGRRLCAWLVLPRSLRRDAFRYQAIFVSSQFG